MIYPAFCRRERYKPNYYKSLSFFLKIKLIHGAWILITQIGCRRLAAHTHMRQHLHTIPEIFYVHGGRLELRIFGRKILIGKGALIMLPAGAFHAFESKTTSELYYINYFARLDKNCSEFRRRPQERRLVFPRAMMGQGAENLTPLFAKILSKDAPPSMKAMECGLAKLLLLIRQGLKDGMEISDIKASDTAGYDRRVAESMRYMRKNALKLNLSDMCRNHFAMTPRHFSRIFKRSTGYSPREYLTALKMKSAAAMLNKKNPAKVVAEKLGYDDVFSFYRAFHKATGHGVLLRNPQKA